MSEMIERVALAISGSSDLANVLGIDRDRARAAIEAMREPTEAMIQAAHSSDMVDAEPGGILFSTNPGAAWRAMIDEALRS